MALSAALWRCETMQRKTDFFYVSESCGGPGRHAAMAARRFSTYVTTLRVIFFVSCGAPVHRAAVVARWAATTRLESP